MPRKIVAGNWKMNLTSLEAEELMRDVDALDRPVDVKVLAFVPALFVSDLVKTAEGVKIGVQNFFHEDKGAFTGEISIDQVRSVGAVCGLIGHSERRMLFDETNELLKLKVDAAINKDFSFIFCCGEPLEVREIGEQNRFVKEQLEQSLFHLSADQLKNKIIAYEPVWAIGTGETATTAQAEAMHAEIRKWLIERYDKETAESISILYGGSCNAENAKELFACPNVDGGLIGGASLNAESFGKIIHSF